MSYMRRLAFHRVFEENSGAGSGGGTSDELGKKAADAETARLAKEAEDQKAANEAKKGNEKTFSQIEVEELIKKRLERASEDRKAEELKTQGEFQKLHDALKPKFDKAESDLSVANKRLEDLSAIVKKTIESATKDWPAEVKELFDNNATVESQLAQIEKLTPLATRLSGNSENSGAKKKPPVAGEHGPKGDAKDVNPASTYMRHKYGDSIK